VWDEVEARLDNDMTETTAIVTELNDGASCMLMGDIDKVGRARNDKPVDALADELSSCLQSLHKQ
jgi:hypothetical protein